MALIGIHSHHFNEPSNEINSFICIYILFTITFFIYESIMFVCINWPQYDVISELCLIAVGCMQMGGMFLGKCFQMKKVKYLHLRLREMIDESMPICLNYNFFILIYPRNLSNKFFLVPDSDDAVFSIYWNTEQKSRRFTVNFLKFVFVNRQMYVAGFFYSIYCMSFGNFDTSTWILPFRLLFPFNTETLHRWYLLWFIHFS